MHMTPDELAEIDAEIINDWLNILYYESVKRKMDNDEMDRRAAR